MAQDLMSQIIDTTTKNRLKKSVDDLTAQSDLSRLLYGDTVPWSDRSVWYKIKFRTAQYGGRVRDAWLVLSGRAYIDD